MANYIPVARSSYYRVRDEAAFERWLRENELELVRSEQEPGLVGFVQGPGNEDGLPRWRYDPETEEPYEVDFLGELAAHLAPGWVAVAMEVGHEAQRYLAGTAWAVNAQGERETVSLDEIYGRAARLGPRGTRAEY
jgi:sugar phosphate isomerase/epimerase